MRSALPFLLLGLLGCATIGHPINMSLVPTLKIGATTKEEALAMFGEPEAIISTETLTMVSWSYTTATVFGGGDVANRLDLTFNLEGKLIGKIVVGK